MESLSTENCNNEFSDITDEFLADLENEMPINEASKRIEKTIEDGTGRIFDTRIKKESSFKSCFLRFAEYIAGWVAFKLKRKSEKEYFVSRRPNLPSYVTDHTYARYLGSLSNSWIDRLTYGGLTKPSDELLSWVQSLEKQFTRIHGTEFGERTDALKNLISVLQSDCSHVPIEIVRLYAKFRIHARCRYLNKVKLETAILKRIETRKARAVLAIANQAKPADLQQPSDDLSRAKMKKMKKIVS